MDALEWNPTTGEPYLRLPAPFQNMIITPPRMTDIQPSVAILKDPAVSLWMGSAGPGKEYTEAKAEGWLSKLVPETEGAVQEMKRREYPLSVCPIRHLREEREGEGGDVFLGDVGIYRSSWSHIVDQEERARLIEENNARKVGDPEIAWHVAYYLAPSHHGRGLMTAAVKALIDWSVRWMGVRRIVSSTLDGNHGSLRVLQKCGFVVVDTLVDLVTMDDKKWTIHVVEWKGGKDGV